MEDILYLFAITPHDLGLVIAVAFGCWLLSLFVFWLFYSVCFLAAGLSMRLGYTFGLVFFFISIFFVFTDLTKYFAWWHHSPGAPRAVLGDAVLILGLGLLWVILVWAIWPRPQQARATA